MSVFKEEQYVCKVCGFNIIGYHPQNCPFCGASKDNFITAEKCSQEYEVISSKVNDKVYCINSRPPLGLEHNAYRIQSNGNIIWVNCPSTFNEGVKPMDYIIFTHHHFIAAANLYKKHFGVKTWIHKKDSNNFIADKYDFDIKFESDFSLHGIQSYHIDGHISGFTSYIFEETLFICDYVFTQKEAYRFNPYGPYGKTLDGARDLINIISKKRLKFVCGYNYYTNFKDWIIRFEILLKKR
jgi:hypothetical protein